MNTYKIELEDFNNARLIADDNPKAERPFDGGHIHYAPARYPSKICTFDYGQPTYRAGDENRPYAQPVSYPKEMLDYCEITVNSADEYREAYAKYMKGVRIDAAMSALS